MYNKYCKVSKRICHIVRREIVSHNLDWQLNDISIIISFRNHSTVEGSSMSSDSFFLVFSQNSASAVRTVVVILDPTLDTIVVEGVFAFGHHF